ncbi:response regulator transcription factor [Streptomyces sp. NPDC059009]|uniref:helix-turn-helix transcriptional regulator n=1 Tax=Streptomyces sp. NPDC059009 TaxID=3346694 RepID=UPI0036CA9FDF
MRAALVRLRRGTDLPVAFGGLIEDTVDAADTGTGRGTVGQRGGRRVRIAELSGTGTHVLRGLTIASGSGLGGKAIALSRPCAVTDYRVSRHISHEYDVAVETEGLRSVLAVPVVVRRRVRGVLYGALRSAQPLGDRALAAAVAAARDVEQSLVVRDEAHDLLATAREPVPGPGASGAWEQIREAHGALRALAPRVLDPTLRAELLSVCGQLATAGATMTPPARPVSLAPREVDVLACVAGGATNATTAERLGLRPETVKGYLRSAMRKLGAHTRLEAVVAARRAGLLP